VALNISSSTKLLHSTRKHGRSALHFLREVVDIGHNFGLQLILCQTIANLKFSVAKCITQRVCSESFTFPVPVFRQLCGFPGKIHNLVINISKPLVLFILRTGNG
jgi:hypothetical protein